MCLFILQNAIICVLFALAFLAGGILNAVYAYENGHAEFCRHLEHAVATQSASAVS